MGSFNFGEMNTCAECKKEFFVVDKDAWVYKRIWKSKRLSFCSYGCMREFEKRCR